jgi:hypothetical protein
MLESWVSGKLPLVGGRRAGKVPVEALIAPLAILPRMAVFKGPSQPVYRLPHLRFMAEWLIAKQEIPMINTTIRPATSRRVKCFARKTEPIAAQIKISPTTKLTYGPPRFRSKFIGCGCASAQFYTTLADDEPCRVRHPSVSLRRHHTPTLTL